MYCVAFSEIMRGHIGERMEMFKIIQFSVCVLSLDKIQFIVKTKNNFIFIIFYVL